MATIQRFEDLEIWKSQLYRALDDKYVNKTESEELYFEINKETKRISSFIIYLNNSKIKGLKFKDRA